MILVTGATGFIGSAFVKKLFNSGKQVRILTRDKEKLKKLRGVKVVQGDILNPASLKKALRDVDIVVHLAGLVSYSKPRSELFRVNVEGTRNLLEACSDCDLKRFIFSSSVSVLGPTPIDEKVDEDSPYNPINPYGQSKMHAEKDIMQADFPSIILRMAPIYGSGSPSWKKNLGLLEKGFPIPDVESKTHIVHISDVVQAFLLSLEKGSGIYLIADKKPIKFLRLAEMLMENLEKKPKILPEWLIHLAARLAGMRPYLKVLTMNRNYDISKARKELGYEPKANLEEEIKKMVDWYLSEKRKKESREEKKPEKEGQEKENE